MAYWLTVTVRDGKAVAQVAGEAPDETFIIHGRVDEHHQVTTLTLHDRQKRPAIKVSMINELEG